MKDLKILAGKWKGKSVPIPPDIKGHSHFTPSVVKEACFSILESFVLDGKLSKETSVFVDLFAGSGQMGWEALSRGWQNCWLVELSRQRFHFLKKHYSEYVGFRFLHRDGFRVKLNDLPDGCQSVCLFFDFPYSFWQQKFHKIKENLQTRAEELTEIDKIILVQTPVSLQLAGFVEKKYGNHYLVVYKG